MMLLEAASAMDDDVLAQHLSAAHGWLPTAAELQSDRQTWQDIHDTSHRRDEKPVRILHSHNDR